MNATAPDDMTTVLPATIFTDLPGYILRRASSAILEDLNNNLEPLSLRAADAAFLMLIRSSTQMTQSEAGRALDIQRANMVPFVSRLEQRGLITRKRVDGRSQTLHLTANGRALTLKAQHIVESFETVLINRVPDTLRAHVMPILLALWNRPSAAEVDTR